MTSSLVGSEMCIRDSKIGSQAEAADLADGVQRDRCHVTMIDIMQEAKSVSYTHLTLPTICSV
eukprot:9186475-Prorocentrum_lima.AAC.1